MPADKTELDTTQVVAYFHNLFGFRTASASLLNTVHDPRRNAALGFVAVLPDQGVKSMKFFDLAFASHLEKHAAKIRSPEYRAGVSDEKIALDERTLQRHRETLARHQETTREMTARRYPRRSAPELAGPSA